MGSSATAQINVRIDRELKEAGDRGLARRGITPSQAVRALWGIFATDGEEADRTSDVLLGMDFPREPTETETARLQAMQRFEDSQKSFMELLAEAGVDPSSFTPMTEEEMREARYEHLLEKYGV